MKNLLFTVLLMVPITCLSQGNIPEAAKASISNYCHDTTGDSSGLFQECVKNENGAYLKLDKLIAKTPSSILENCTKFAKLNGARPFSYELMYTCVNAK